MKKLSPDELKSRLRLDFDVCQRMFGKIFSGEAYRYTTDLEGEVNPIKSSDHGHLALKYRIDFHVRTLIGQGQFTNLTTIGFDLEVDNYPFNEPRTWVITSPVPYSPHFKEGSPVCIGEIWEQANGRMLLGELLVYIARLLNWDNQQNLGYPGWNEESAAYAWQVFRGRPITNLGYPVLPTDLLFGFNPTSPSKVPVEPLFFRGHVEGANDTHPDSTVTSQFFRGREIRNE